MRNLVLSLLIPITFTLTTSSAMAEIFSDVEEGEAHFVAINYLKEQGIIDGYNDNTFKAWKKINRAEALKMLVNAALKIQTAGIGEEITIPEISEDPFKDVSMDDWYAKYAAYAKEKGIISGYNGGYFYPEKTINLAETLKIFLESFDGITFPEPTAENLFADTPAEEWFAKYTAYAGQKGMVNIDSDNNIHPEKEMTRGYTAEIIYRMIKSEEGLSFGKATFYGEAVQGNHTASGDIFDMNKMTAAHKTLPFGTIVKVTNLANGKSVEVTINDRGPYGYGRVIDLSSAAFEQIAWLGTGIIDIQFEIIHTP